MSMFNQWQPPQPQMWNYPQMPQQQQPQQPQSNLDWIMVSSVDQIDKVTVQPGQKAWIMVQNDAVFALRTADQVGIVNTDYYRFEKWSPTANTVPTADFVTRPQMEEAIQSAINKLIKEAKANKSSNG